MPDDRSRDLDLLVTAVRAAGDLACDYLRGEIRSWDKSPGNPVCDADLAIDALLKERLLGSRPDYGWLSEETADDPARLARQRVWVVDPIDGTRDFLRGRTGFAVSIALVEAGEPVLAALYAPRRDQLFVAKHGAGATLNGAPIRISAATDIAGCRIPADAASLKSWDATPVEKPNALTLRIAKVASGEADAFFEKRTVGEWDVAAATLILQEAGGIITDRNGDRFAFNRPQPRVPGIIAATPALYAAIRDRAAA